MVNSIMKRLVLLVFVRLVAHAERHGAHAARDLYDPVR